MYAITCKEYRHPVTLHYGPKLSHTLKHGDPQYKAIYLTLYNSDDKKYDTTADQWRLTKIDGIPWQVRQLNNTVQIEPKIDYSRQTERIQPSHRG